MESLRNCKGCSFLDSKGFLLNNQELTQNRWNAKILLPASTAFFAATLKSLTIWGISSVDNRCGGENCATSIPLALTWGARGLSVLEIGAWPLGWYPWPNKWTYQENINRNLTRALTWKISWPLDFIFVSSPHAFCMPKLERVHFFFFPNLSSNMLKLVRVHFSL